VHLYSWFLTGCSIFHDSNSESEITPLVRQSLREKIVFLEIFEVERRAHQLGVCALAGFSFFGMK
jgi:hypothetical protein